MKSVMALKVKPGSQRLEKKSTIYFLSFLLDGKLLENLSWPLKHVMQYLAYGRSLTSITLLIKKQSFLVV